MWPARIRSAPAVTSARSTRLRCDTGRLRAARQGAPSMWWCSTMTRSAFAGASRKRRAALELDIRPREPRGKRVRHVVIPRDGQDRHAERGEEAVRALVLLSAAAVSQITRSDDQLRPDTADQRTERLLDLRILACTRVQIGYMEEGGRHDRMRL